MENVFPNLLIELLTSSLILSVIIMVLIQKCKSLTFLNKSWHAWVLNLVFSFLIGIPFSITFFDYSVVYSLWVSFFSFVGASSIYEALKTQNLINYKPVAIDDKIVIDKSKEIKRGDQ